jgi:ferredoxin
MSGQWLVEVEHTCVGNQMCVALAPEVFDFVDGKSTVRSRRQTPSAELADAYESCPVSAIVLRDEHGREIEPND